VGHILKVTHQWQYLRQSLLSNDCVIDAARIVGYIMRSSVYVTVGCPFVRLSVPSIDCGSGSGDLSAGVCSRYRSTSADAVL